MTDLDRQIAELKGLRMACIFGDTDFGAVGMDLEIIPGSGSFERVDCWSTSDAKAFELVDELTSPNNSRLREWFFYICTDSTNIGDWMASFLLGRKPRYHDPISKIGKTRAEAICKAYIAVIDWERGSRK